MEGALPTAPPIFGGRSAKCSQRSAWSTKVLRDEYERGPRRVRTRSARSTNEVHAEYERGPRGVRTRSTWTTKVHREEYEGCTRTTPPRTEREVPHFPEISPPRSQPLGQKWCFAVCKHARKAVISQPICSFPLKTPFFLPVFAGSPIRMKNVKCRMKNCSAAQAARLIFHFTFSILHLNTPLHL